jgi:hypothetical protein|tara:strand:- start:801 stop:1091 length:291 start_codon:yes stop_codon:yes gene_type:complete
MKTITGLYSVSDWAELFSICANIVDKGGSNRDQPEWEQVHAWLCEWSKTHGFPPPEETETWSDTGYVIKEAVMFLEKFAENHHDDFENRKESNEAG